MRRTTRRAFLDDAGKVIGASPLLYALGAPAIASAERRVAEGWETASEILARVKPPRFPNRDFVITEYGAIGDGESDCTGPLAAAIDACANAGGGRVVVPPGSFATGAVHLKSNVNLHLAAGAKIDFSRDRAKYLPVVYTRYEGVELFNHSAPIYAYRQRNIAVTGSGRIDGRADGDHWWNLAGSGGENPDKAALNQMAQDGVPVARRIFGEGHNLRVNLVRVESAERALYLIGNDENPIRHVRLTNCLFEDMAEDNLIRNVEGLRLKNVTIGTERL